MTENVTRELKPVRLMIRVHIREISPMDVAELQEGIRDVLGEYPDAEIETAMLPVLPPR